MKFTTAAVAAAGIASAAAAPAPAPAETVDYNYFGVIAARSGSPFHLQPWAANGREIWIGKKTASYCPDQVDDCPPGKYTDFLFGDGSLSMGTEVPGGQQAYIKKCGTVAYTAPHSAYIPKGAVRAGWHYNPGQEGSVGYLTHKGGIFACSVHGDAQKGPWKVKVQLPGLEFGDECLGMQAATSNSTNGPDAWEYT